MDESLRSLVGQTLVGVDGQKIGRIDAIYVKSSTGDPEWAAISLGGLLATKWTFAPVARVAREGDHAVVDFDKKFVKHAPSTHTEGVLSPAENQALYHYYGMTLPAEAAGSHDAALHVR